MSNNEEIIGLDLVDEMPDYYKSKRENEKIFRERFEKVYGKEEADKVFGKDE